MRQLLDNILIIIGVTIGLILFLMGLRRALKAREPRTSADKILIAASITILSLMPNGFAKEVPHEGCYEPPDDEPIRTDTEKDIKNRFAEIKASEEWRELSGIWRELLESLKENEPLSEETSKWIQSECDDMVHSKWEEKRKGFVDDNGRLVSEELAITELKALAIGVAQHITMSQNSKSCYKAGPFKGEKPITETQLEMLEKQLKDGKISKEAAEKIKSALEAYNRTHWGNVPSLNKASADLIARLLSEFGIDKAKVCVLEIKETKEWQELKKIWAQLDSALKEKKPIPDELNEWREKSNLIISRDEFRKREQQPDYAPLMDVKDALKEMNFLTLEFANHVRMITAHVECYRKMELPRADLTEAQITLLEEQLKAGKIEKPLYEKIKRAMESFKERGTLAAKGLNKDNAELIFRLIREINAEPEKSGGEKK